MAKALSSSGVVITNSPGTLRTVSWKVTLLCPLKCAHCSVNAGGSEPPRSFLDLGGIPGIDQIRETANPVVILSGGEPLMRKDIFEIVRYGISRVSAWIDQAFRGYEAICFLRSATAGLAVGRVYPL